MGYRSCFLPGVALLSILSLQVAYAQKAAPQKPPPVYNCDIPQLFEKMLAAVNQLPARTQFETEDAFNQRKGQALREKFPAIDKELTCEISAATLVPTAPSYDPEKKEISFYANSLPSLPNGFFPFRSEHDLGSSPGLNTFGLQQRVENIQIKWHGIVWSKKIESPASVKISPEDAQSQWKQLSLAVTGKLEVPYITANIKVWEPTAQRPISYTHQYLALVMRPSKLTLWNTTTGALLKEWRPRDCNGYIYSWDKCLRD